MGAGMIRAIVTFGYVGLLKPAPGTWGSAAGLALGIAIHWLGGFPLLALATLGLTLLGFWACVQALKDRPGDDPGEIVVDEVAGVLLAYCIPALAFFGRGNAPDLLPWPAPLATFLLFRLFDIWKPWLVGRADRRGDVRGVMEDDLWAGLFAGLGTIVLGFAYHWVFVF
jgi:phosphatidylglycerophosphatase A